MKNFDLLFFHPPRYFLRPRTGIKKRFSHFLRPQKHPQGPSQYALIPMGLLSLASSLIDHGYTTKVVNLALTQDRNPSFNLEKYVKSLQATIFAIDLHWFTHTASALHLASLLKQYHPNSLIILGGINATHFYEELLKTYLCVDGVLLGEAETSIVQLVTAYLRHHGLDDVQGIAYRKGASIRYRRPEAPVNLDRFDFTNLELLENYDQYLKTDINGYSNHLSKRLWLNIARGCLYNCIHCGGSCWAYQRFSRRDTPALRSPQRVADDFEYLCDHQVQGICLSHDPQIFGKKYWESLLKEIRARGIDTAAYIESFRVPSKEFIWDLHRTFNSALINLSPETSSEDVRRQIGRDFSNEAFFKSIRVLTNMRFTVHVYLSIGLPGETLDMIKTYKKFIDKIMNLGGLVIPPFPYTIDPNCLMALNPEKYGVRLYLKTLEDYKHICSSQNPKDWIGHATTTLTKEDISMLQSFIHQYVSNLYNHRSMT